jgi:hypothetical protein
MWFGKGPLCAIAGVEKVNAGSQACGGLAAALVFANPGGPVPAIFIAATWLFVPGWTCVRPLRIANPAARALISLIAGAVVTAILSLVMVWTTLWLPQFAAAAVLLAASGLLAFMPRRPIGVVEDSLKLVRSRTRRNFIGWVPVSVGVVAVLLWIAGLAFTDTDNIGAWGLLPAFPFIWYLAVAAILALFIWGLTARRVFPRRYMAGLLAVLIAMLYSSANIIEAAPRLPWAYKHMAVTSFIDQFGRVDPSIDLYNRWPGFFAVSAFLGRIAGYRDPAAYATWAELAFPLIDAALVFAIAQAILKSPRASWTAAIVFTVCNWVNQNYYSPQAFAFTLYLAMCLAIMTLLRGTPAPWMEAIERRIGRLVGASSRHTAANMGSTSPSRAARGGRWYVSERKHQRQLRIAAIAAVLVLQSVIAATHQLTPYLAVLELLPLSVVGYVRPRWLGWALLGIAVAYLLPNLGYIESTYGLFSGFDFFANLTYTPPGDAQTTGAAQFGSRAASILSGLTVLLAAAGWLRNLLRGNVGTTLIVGWLAAAPVLALLGQTYGGEGRMRVFLFGVPWYAIGVAWLFSSGPVLTRRHILGLSSALTAMTVLFAITYFQPESDHVVALKDTRAAHWLDARVTKGDLAVEAVADFPIFIGPNYWLYDSATGKSSLATYLEGSPNAISGTAIESYLKNLATAPHTYVIFSDTQAKYASLHNLFDIGLLNQVEDNIRGDSQFREVFDNSAVRIFELR